MASTELDLDKLQQLTAPLKKGASDLERRAHDEALYIDAKKFAEILALINKTYTGLVLLHEAVAANKTGNKSLKKFTFTDEEGRERTVTQQGLHNLDERFRDSIKMLKRFYRVANKKPKRKADPSKFKGVHKPIFVGPALTQFLTTADFGYCIPNDPSSGRLSDCLVRAKQGLLMRNTLNMLFYVYIYHNSLYAETSDKSFVKSNEVMDLAFGSSHPAVYTLVQNGTKTKFHKKTKTQSETPNIVKDVNKDNRNTYDILTEVYKNNNYTFEKSRFKMFFLQAISSINIYDDSDIQEVEVEGLPLPEYLLQDSVRSDMLQEHEVTRRCSEAWDAFNCAASAANAAKVKAKAAADAAACAAGSTA